MTTRQFQLSLLPLGLSALVLSAVLGIVLVLNQTLSVSAEDSSEDIDPSLLVCSRRMAAEGEEAFAEFNELVGSFFLSDIPTHEQVDKGLEFYRAFEAGLQNIYEEEAIPKQNISLESATKDIQICGVYRDQYLRAAQSILQAHVRGSSNTKRSFRVRDAMNEFNDNLEDLSETYFDVFPNNFKQMNNALPCFAKQCI